MPCPRTIYGIARDCETSKGGVARVFLSPYQDGAVKYSPNDFTVTGFSEYITFSEFYQRKGAASFTTTANIDLDNDLKFFKTTINLSFPKMSGEKSFYLDRLLLNPMIAMIEDNNGNNWIFGIDNPVYTEQYSMQTGSNPKDANKYTVVLTCESDYEPKSVGHSIPIPTDKPITNIIYRLISDWGEQIIPSTGGTRTAYFTGVTTYVYEDGTTKVNETTWSEIYTFNPNQTAENQNFDKQQTFYDQLDKFTYIQLPNESGKQLIGTYYEIYPPSTSATVAAEATSYTFNWSGITVSAWSDGSITSAVTYTERKTVTFSENTSTTQDKYYGGKYAYNGVEGDYTITQLKKGSGPLPPTPSEYEKEVLVGDKCYNELPEGTDIVDDKIITSITFELVPSEITDNVPWNQTSYTFNYNGITIYHYSDGSTTSSVTYTNEETITFSENQSTTHTKVNNGTYTFNNVIGIYEIIQGLKPEIIIYTKREYVDERCYEELPPNTKVND